MADKAKLSQISKTELAEAYSRLKGRISKQAASARTQNEKMISDAITVASGGGLGYYMGKLQQEAGGENASEEAIAEKQQIAGVDLDLLVGGVAAAVGLTGMGGKMSDAVRAVGVGALTEWAGRVGYDKGMEAAT